MLDPALKIGHEKGGGYRLPKALPEQRDKFMTTNLILEAVKGSKKNVHYGHPKAKMTFCIRRVEERRRS